MEQVRELTSTTHSASLMNSMLTKMMKYTSHMPFLIHTQECRRPSLKYARMKRTFQFSR